MDEISVFLEKVLADLAKAKSTSSTINIANGKVKLASASMLLATIRLEAVPDVLCGWAARNLTKTMQKYQNNRTYGIACCECIASSLIKIISGVNEFNNSDAF